MAERPPDSAAITSSAGHALDRAPENVAAVARSAAVRGPPVPVTALTGRIVALSFPDDSFDAVWCANTTRYPTDDEPAAALGEFRRVVRFGGFVAMSATRHRPRTSSISPIATGARGMCWRSVASRIGPLCLRVPVSRKRA